MKDQLAIDFYLSYAADEIRFEAKWNEISLDAEANMKNHKIISFMAH